MNIPKPTIFKPEISLGSIATLIVSVTMAYGQIKAEITLRNAK